MTAKRGWGRIREEVYQRNDYRNFVFCFQKRQKREELDGKRTREKCDVVPPSTGMFYSTRDSWMKRKYTIFKWEGKGKSIKE